MISGFLSTNILQLCCIESIHGAEHQNICIQVIMERIKKFKKVQSTGIFAAKING